MPINLANVDVGSGPSAGDGDTLRSAFITINDNFAKLQVNVNALTNSVTTVAGRTGNVSLTVQDIIGINNLATITYVSSAIANANVTSNLNSLAANISLLQSDVNLLFGNAGVQSGSLAQLTANAAAQAGSLADLTANAAAQAGELGSLLANAGVQAGEISSLLANAGSQHTAISDLQSNAAVQAGLINELQGNVYANSKVAAYLVNYGGNVSVNTIVFDDLSEQYTAYTGTQWRSNLTSDLTVKPSWLSYYPDGLKTVEGTNYGFDASGMFFYGSADNEHAYPIRTNTHLHANDVAEVVATFHLAHVGDDHGIAIFPVGTTPIWKYATDSSRIAWQLNATIPVIYGQSNTATTGNTLTVGNYYTAKFVYDPTNTLTVNVYNGNAAVGSPVDTISLSEALPTGDYVIGFDADQDVVSNRSYFKNLIVRTLTNTVVNDFEVRGQITGNLIPDANVTYSLGNITHQWKDLWVSNSTIYIGGVPITTSNGILTVNNQPVTGASLVNSDGNAQITANDGVISYTWTFETDGSIRTPDNLLTIGGYTLQTNDDNELDLGNGDDITLRANIGNIAIGTDWNTNQYTWQFRNDGNLVLPNGTRILDIGSIGSDTSGLRLGNHGFTLDFGSAANDWAILSGASLIQVQPDDTFNITFAELANWQFSNTAVLTLPMGGTISESTYFSADSIILKPHGGTSTQYLEIAPTAVDGNHLHLMTGGGTELFLGDDNHYVKLANTGGVVVNSNDNLGNTAQWIFGIDGILTLPGNIISGNSRVNFVANSSGDGNGFSTIELRPDDVNTGSENYLIIDPTSPNHIHIRAGGTQDNSQAELYLGGENSYFKVNNGANPYVSIAANNYVWSYGVDGNLTFPDSTVQTTAWTGTVEYANVANTPAAYGNAEVSTYLANYDGSITFTASPAIISGLGSISTVNANVSGNLTFGDSTVQSTAWTGSAAEIDITDTNGLTTTYYPTFVENRTNGQIARADTNLTYRTDDNILGVGNIAIGTAGNIKFADNTVQTTAWTGTISYGNTISIGYLTGNTSQGNNAVAIGSTAGQTSQGAKAIGIGEVAGRLNQGIESVGLGAGAGEQNQGAYAIAIGSTTAYLNQGVGAVAIGTSAGALYQGQHAIAIGTGAGNGLQGNNSIILNATGSTLNQTTDNTFTVKPIRAASSGNILYYDPNSGEITYSTNSGTGTYTNANVVSLLSNFGSNSITTTGNITAANFVGNISLTGNVVGTSANVTLVAGSYSWTFDNAGNLVLPGNVFAVNYANGTAVSLGGAGSTYGNANVAVFLSNFGSNTVITTGNITAGNVRATTALRFDTGNVRVTNDANRVNLIPDTTADALAGVLIGGNGYLLAPNGSRNITLNYGGGSGVVGLQANVQVGSAGTGTVLVPGFTSTGVATIVAGVPNTLLPNTVASFSSNVNSYTQLTLQNKSTGGDATSDIVLTSDAGSDTTNYVDIGIINSGYDNATPTNSLGNVVFANDAYLYAQGNTSATIGGNLTIGTTTAGKSVKVFAGGNTASSIVMTVANTGVTVTGNINSGNIITTGNIIGSSPNVTITANTYVTTFDIYGNVTVPGTITVNGLGVLAPGRPAFRINGTGLTSQSTSNVNLKGAAVTTIFNQGSYFDATTGKFTAPVAGIYEVLLNARIDGSYNGMSQIAVLKNGVNTSANIVAFWETSSNVGTATHFGVSGTVQLAAGDYLSANILAGNVNFDGNDNWCVTYLG